MLTLPASFGTELDFLAAELSTLGSYQGMAYIRVMDTTTKGGNHSESIFLSKQTISQRYEVAAEAILPLS